MSASTASLTSVSIRCTNSFKPARPSRSVTRLTRFNVVAESRQQAGSKKAVMSGLAALASVPLLFGGPAVAFVGNTASDFADKVNRYTPTPSSISDVLSSKVDQVTPDVPLPGLKQKGKEAEAIGAAPNKSGPGAADQLPAPEAVPSNDSVAHATDVTKDGGGVKGGEFSITDSDKVKGAASNVADKAADIGGGALQNVKPKRGFFERINDEALTKNSPSVQQKR
ncbi:hypothetical protein ABBQ38_011188 [Trebouxia sp. C0009 RCD-2024]